MKEWKEYKLGNICSKIGSGATPWGGSNAYKEFGIPLIRSQNVLDFSFSASGLAFIDENQASELKNVIVNENDILLNITGDSVARCCVVPKEYVPARVNQHVAIIRPFPEKAYFRYIFYYLQFLKPEILIAAEIGATRNAITKGMIEEIDIPIPPLPEQRAIAAVLSSLDDKIDLLHRQNATLEAMAEALFRQWFVQLENDGTISQLVSIQNGFAFKSKDFREIGNHGVIKIRNISGGVIDIEKTDFVSDPIASNVHERFKITTGDILIAMTGAEIGKLGIIPKSDKNLWLNQRVGLLKEKYEGSKYLAYLQLKSEFGQDYIENTASGSAQPNISSIGIENCGFPKLSKAQIEKSSTRIGKLYDKVIFNLGQIRTLTALRDTLLPKLMSGEVRVKY